MIDNYTPDSDSIIHTVKADFIKSLVNEPIRLVQGDKQIPVIAVKLYMEELQYIIPDNVDIYLNISVNTGVHYKIPAEGYNVVNNETIVYFLVDETLTQAFGTYKAIVTVEMENGVAGTSYFNVIINKHPIQPGTVPYTIESNGSNFNVIAIIQDLQERVAALEEASNNS